MLKISPRMAAGVTDRLWAMVELSICLMRLKRSESGQRADLPPSWVVGQFE